ncbi:TauD/TfdA dioxygenase family protein [Novosphingobium sp. JCM 18896]|uniref:TauD/TfdA dioxygenase family protein n=1 Tax=Novosphingobium sp. JCM 18896 TaxID=2989731 RepID=UPI002222B13C|nr:TauD/TfdA family dioxygenase [Novosphingobium sp. JCM 18896]MCW1429857.1 TauD/TfdA family dioxygenase [Novosphingobium sp. JCM 18896]
MDIRALEEGLPFGARVGGLTAGQLQDEDIRARLQQLFEDRGVIVFEDVEPTAQMQVAVSTVFGPLKDHPVNTVARADRDDSALTGVIEIATGDEKCVVEIDGKPLITWQPWHFDHAYNDELNRAGVLRSIKIAKDGGKTGFADGAQIWRDMDPAIRAKAETLEVLYNLDLRYTHQKFGLPKTFRELRPHDIDMEAMIASKPRSIHPAVWTRDSGEKVFHMTPYGCQGLVGDESPAAFALLSEIWDEAMRVIKPYYHQWHATDMVIWDNWRVLHEACGCNPNEERIVHRTTIKGDYGLGRFETTPELSGAA